MGTVESYRFENEDGSITWGYENEDGSYKVCTSICVLIVDITIYVQTIFKAETQSFLEKNSLS